MTQIIPYKKIKGIKLICFLQKRNLNLPAIAFKLNAIKSRSLAKATRLWNLVPTFKNINSRKNDKLLSFDEYIEDFCMVQYKAFLYICEKKLDKDLESYVDGLRIENPYDLKEQKGQDEFHRKLRECLSPLYQIARNQGFEVMDKICGNRH